MLYGEERKLTSDIFSIMEYCINKVRGGMDLKRFIRFTNNNININANFA
jgi:hypothetical protein